MFDLVTLTSLSLGAAALGFAYRTLVRRVVVASHEAVVLVRNGVVRGELAPGVHRFALGDVRVERFDRRETLVRVFGQEVPTKDHVPVRCTAQVRQRVVDALRVHSAVEDATEHVHAAAQLALRDAVAEVTLDELLAARSAVSARLAARLGPALCEVGLVLVDAALQDVVVPGELKRAYGDVAKARAEGAARLERARAEAAAMRSLANAARLLHEHAGLDRLMTLGVARAAAEAGKSTLVLGLDEPDRLTEPRRAGEAP